MNDEEINEISDDVEIVADAIERKKILSEIIPRRLIVNMKIWINLIPLLGEFNQIKFLIT